MEHDTSDILGHKTLPPLDRNQRASFFRFSLTGALFTSFLLWGIYTVGNRLWRRILQWRERSYKLATRRRHGIPDSDLRPFNVAYADAVRAREEETRRLSKPRPAALRPHASLPSQREMQLDQNVRQRQGVSQRHDPGIRSTLISVPGRYATASYEPEPQIPAAETSIASDNHYLKQNRVQTTTGESSKPSGLLRQGGYLDISDAENLSDGEGKKRALDAEPDQEHEAKKSRVEGDELIDGDEDAEFEDIFPPKRGSKRGMHDEVDSEEPSPSHTSRGKRARKVSHEKRRPIDDTMDVDDEEADQITDLRSTVRGKKRDRTEAGSTFGGEDEDSAAEPELESDVKPRRHRKRRTVAKRKSEVSYIRGKQRAKDGEDVISDASSGRNSPDREASYKKKSRRSSHIDRRNRERRDSKSDVSMDESTTSTRSKVRSIGDEWESNGVKYKIGLNGQRLRQALVKKARQKFVMPKDSQHPDRDVNLQVYVESWLTEEEYAEAKAQHLLAWQDPLPPTRQEGTEKLSLNISNHVASPQGQQTGKNLLWSQSTTSTPTLSPTSQSPVGTPSEIGRQRSFRHSLAGTPVGFSMSPFTQSQIPTVKRIASNSRAVSFSTNVRGSPGLTDSTNGRVPHKVFSKWEKQELEAQAMMKIREATRKKEMEKEAKIKEEREKAEREAAERQRLEKERQERERIEKEKAAAAAAEVERKAKEVAEQAKATSAAPPPQITVTAPPASLPTTSSSSSVPNFFAQPAASTPKADSSSPFSFAKSSTTTTTPTLDGAASATAAPSTAAPNFSFAPNTSAQKPGGSFGFTAPSTASGGEQKNDVAASATTTGSSASGASSNPLFSRLGPQPAEAPKTQATAAAPLFSFPKTGETSSSSTANPPSNPFGPSTGTSTNSTTTGAGATTAPKFSFNLNNKPSTPAPTHSNASKPTSAFPSNTSSLSGALGGGAGASGSGNEEAPKPVPMFSFKTPSTPATATTGAAAVSTTPSTTPAPKFNFAPSTTSSSSTTAASPFSGTQQQGKDGEKKPTFGMAGPTAGTGGFGSSTTATNSPFGNASAFGTSNAPSAFGSTTSTTPSVFGAASAPSAFGGATSAPSAFGGGGAKATPVFGGGSGATTASPFGATSAQTSSVFGGGATTGDNKPAAADAGAAKPTFSFGNTGTSSTPTSTPATGPGTGATINTTTPKFSFGVTATPSAGGSTTPAGTPASGIAGGSSGFSFKFGQPSSTSTTTNGTTTPQSSPFGAPAATQTSLFGGVGTNTSTTNSTSNAFGGGIFGSATPKQS